jgi:hypothetical protein
MFVFAMACIHTTDIEKVLVYSGLTMIRGCRSNERLSEGSERIPWPNEATYVLGPVAITRKKETMY